MSSSFLYTFGQNLPPILLVLPEDGGLRLDVVLDLEEGEEDDSGVGGEEDEDVPGAVEVGEAHRGPPGTEHPGGSGWFSKEKSRIYQFDNVS